MKANAEVRAFLKVIASKGGRARAKVYTKAQRVTQAKRAARARWGKRKEV
jgi:hypothetical protein